MSMHTWIRTYSGGQFFPLDPMASEIRIEDVAHALSHLCRFTGHCRDFYSVAEHSVRVANYVLDRTWRTPGHESLVLEALLHDATEAYLNDLATPVKHQPDLTGYRVAESKLAHEVALRYGLMVPQDPLITKADHVLLATEARDLLPPGTLWTPEEEPLHETIRPWTSKVARQQYLNWFEAFYRGDGTCPVCDSRTERGFAVVQADLLYAPKACNSCGARDGRFDV